MIENPASSTYVGLTPEGNEEPVTLQLGIPADFERITFNKESHGRQFSVVGGSLATGIPWTPADTSSSSRMSFETMSAIESGLAGLICRAARCDWPFEPRTQTAYPAISEPQYPSMMGR